MEKAILGKLGEKPQKHSGNISLLKVCTQLPFHVIKPKTFGQYEIYDILTILLTCYHNLTKYKH